MSAAENSSPEPIAIIGMSCRLPGAANPEALWQAIVEKRDCVADYPGGRSPELDAFYAQAGVPNFAPARRGGFLPDLDKFDASFFEISPREAEWTDPQQRLLLELSWEAMEDAGLTREELAGSKAGVFIGVWASDYERHSGANAPVADFFHLAGGPLYGASSRVSYQFDLRGPDVSVNAACASSLVAIHLAVRALRAGECSLAFAGGVNMIFRHELTQALGSANVLSKDGRCKFGDAGADGFVRSEGIGVLVCKRLVDAERDGDRILALIRGTAVTNNGQVTGSMSTPSEVGQSQAMLDALADGGVDPISVDYVEAHGTGTRAGDPVELAAISSVFAKHAARNSIVRVGSVKSNIGHTESTAGVASVIKTIQAFRHGYFPPTIHVEQLNPAVDWENNGVRLELNGSSWLKNESQLPRRASVNGLGLTGTNAHVVLEEAPAQARREAEARVSYMLPISAASDVALRQRAGDLARRFGQLDLQGSETLSDLVYTLASRRTHLTHRLVLAGGSSEELQASLRGFAGGKETQFSASGIAERGGSRKVAFVFPGQGSQWAGMGRELLKTEPVFRSAIQTCDEAIHKETGWSLLEQLQNPAYEERLTRIDTIQPTLFAMEVALAELWKSWGIVPDAVVGHSMGEVAAAQIAGVLSLVDAVKIICRRSRLLMRVAGLGAMVVVDLTRTEAEQAITGLEDRVSIAVSNSPRSTVLAGDPKVLDSLVARLEEQEVFCRWVRVDVASHSPQMDPLKEDLFAALSDLEPRPAKVPLFSTVRAGVIGGDAGLQMNTAYWVDNLRETVQFAKSIEMLIQQGFETFIEMSPHPILTPFIEQTAEHVGKKVLAIGSLRREEPESSTLLLALGKLYVNGLNVDWKRIYPAGNLVSIPAYPWQRERFWIESSTAKSSFTLAFGHPLIGEGLRVATGDYLWTVSLASDLHPWLKDHGVDGSVLLPASAYVEIAHAVGVRIFTPDGASQGVSVEHLKLDQTITLNSDGVMHIQLVASPQPDTSFRLAYFTRQDAKSEWVKAADAVVKSVPLSGAETVSVRDWEDAEFSSGTISGLQHTEFFTKFGYEFGPNFRQMEWLALDTGSGLAAIKVPQLLSVTGYRMHPATMDAGLQLLGRLLLEKSGSNGLLLPVEFDRVEFFPSGVIGQVVYSRASVWNDLSLKGDVSFYDDAGRILVKVIGLAFKPLEGRIEDPVDEWMYKTIWEEFSRSAGCAKAVESWLLVADQPEVGTDLSKALNVIGCQTETVGLAQFLDVDRKLPQDLSGVVFLNTLLVTAQTSLREVERLHFQAAQVVRRLTEEYELQAGRGSNGSFRLWVVTRGAQAAQGEAVESPLAAGFWGFAASVSNEHPELHMSCVDLAAQSFAEEYIALADLLVAQSAEDRLLLRTQGCYRLRIVPWTVDRRGSLVVSASGELPGSANAFELKQRVRGSIESLELRSVIHSEPRPGDVEIAVAAGGMNFLDILRAMGINEALSGSHFGGECSGTVLRVGHDVTAFKPGDEVIAISPSFQETTLFASRVTIPAELVVRKPQSMNFVQAAGLPCVFLTAYYALVKLAQLKRGEKVLIHAAAGGVGLAAIQVAHWLGAEVYATVGSQEKRSYIASLGVRHIMNSRTLDFQSEVMGETDGEGVDVVLNSLAGPAITAGLQCLAPYGRFVEIGKRDIWENSKIGLNPFLRNRSFFAVDLAKSVEDRRQMVGQLFNEVIELFASGVFVPLPVTIFPVSQAVEAFRTMAQGKHMGKIILSMTDLNATIRLDASQISSYATYLITGGLGGLGLVAAEALVARGARHLVLVSRREASSEAQTIIAGFERRGVQVSVRSLDISSTLEINALFSEIRDDFPPLRGIIHAAGVLNDAVVRHLTEEKFSTVMSGKVGGALAIDRNVRCGELDFLVYYASAAGVLGTPGQANYAAANAILDGLAHQQRRRGIPAVSIDWGSWAEVGLAAIQQNRGARLVSHGLTPLAPAEGTKLLLRVLEESPVQVVAMRFDATAWCDSNQMALTSGMFSALLNGADRQSGGVQDFGEECRRMPHEALTPALVNWLQEQVAAVLRCGIDRVIPDKALKSLGLDSLMALELRNRLERGLHLKLSATLAWNYPTVVALAAHLETKIQTKSQIAEHAKGAARTESSIAPELPQGNNVSGRIFEIRPSQEPASQPQSEPSAAELLEAELLGVQSLLSK